MTNHTPTPETVKMLSAAYTKAILHNPKAVVYDVTERALNDCPAIVLACNSYHAMLKALELCYRVFKMDEADTMVSMKVGMAISKAKGEI